MTTNGLGEQKNGQQFVQVVNHLIGIRKSKMIEATQQISPNEYTRVHQWLRRKYGKATKCESNGCEANKNFQWALKKNKAYEYKRQNFKQLCAGCHKNYDKSVIRYERVTSESKRYAREWAEGKITTNQFCIKFKKQYSSGYNLIAHSLRQLYFEEKYKDRLSDVN